MTGKTVIIEKIKNFYEMEHGETFYEYDKNTNKIRIGKQQYNVYYEIPKGFEIYDKADVCVPYGCDVIRKGKSLLQPIEIAILMK